MLSIQHKGIHVSLDLDTTTFTGDVETDAELAYVTALLAGKLVALDSSGKVQIADGAVANALHPIGFIVNDAKGEFMMNKPELASKKLAVTFSPCVITTDQIDTALTFAPGEKLYCGTGAKIGLVTNVQPTGGVVLGIALSSADVTSPNLQLAFVGAK